MRVVIIFLMGFLGISTSLTAFKPEIHEKITAIALQAYHAKICIDSTECAKEKYSEFGKKISYGTYAEDSKNKVRWFKWHFYDKNFGKKKAIKHLLPFDRTLHKIFNERIKEFRKKSNDSEKWEYLGRILHYIQDVAVPAHVIPILHPHLSETIDSWHTYDDYSLNLDNLQTAFADLPKTNDELFFNGLLNNTAIETLSAVQTPPNGEPLWTCCFWKMPDPNKKNDKWGSYIKGVKFGDENVKCPLAPQRSCNANTATIVSSETYDAFVKKRHEAAINATILALMYVNMEK